MARKTRPAPPTPDDLHCELVRLLVSLRNGAQEKGDYEIVANIDTRFHEIGVAITYEKNGFTWRRRKPPGKQYRAYFATYRAVKPGTWLLGGVRNSRSSRFRDVFDADSLLQTTIEINGGPEHCTGEIVMTGNPAEIFCHCNSQWSTSIGGLCSACKTVMTVQHGKAASLLKGDGMRPPYYLGDVLVFEGGPPEGQPYRSEVTLCGGSLLGMSRVGALLHFRDTGVADPYTFWFAPSGFAAGGQITHRDQIDWSRLR